VRQAVNTNTEITKKGISFYYFFCGRASLGIHLWPILLMNTDWKVFWKAFCHSKRKKVTSCIFRRHFIS